LTLALSEGRFDRFERIEWWDQSRLAAAKVIVAGAGALGNAVIENLALLGVGHLLIVDMDTIELSNLVRSPLFRADDTGRPKATCAADAARRLYHDIDARAIVGNLTSDVGLGWFVWADVVVGALDNREARVFLNSACARVGTPWVDGGIDVLNGIARVFDPPGGPCYECTMSAADWDLINRRRSCSMLARRALSFGGTPTTPTTASVIGGIQAQEVVKLLHGLPSLAGRGYVFEGLNHSSYTVSYSIDPHCSWHEDLAPIEWLSAPVESPWRDVWNEVESRIGAIDEFEFSREIVAALECTRCGSVRSVNRPIDAIDDASAACSSCGCDTIPALTHGITAAARSGTGSPLDAGLPPGDVIWARNGFDYHGFAFQIGVLEESHV
jgi:molybdopterin/thiamine biosynthesis adenylyltransferase